MAYRLSLLSSLLAVLLAWRSSAKDYTSSLSSSREDGLPLVPVNVKYEGVDSYSVLLKWLQPASVMATHSPTVDTPMDTSLPTEVTPPNQEAHIRSFIIELRQRGARTVRRPVFASKTAVGLQVESDSPVPEGVGFENQYRLLFLKPGVEYIVRIAATNQHGIGPYSAPLTVTAKNTGYQLQIALYILMAGGFLVLITAVGCLIVLSRCPKRVVVFPNSSRIGGHSADTNSISKAGYVEEGCVDESTHGRGHCNQFSDTKPACEDGNSPAATAITTESPDTNSATDVASSKPTADRIKTDDADKQGLKKTRPPKASVSQLFGSWQPRTVLGMHVRVNPIYHSTMEAKLVPWEHTCTEATMKEDTVCLHTGDKEETETARHVCFIV